MNREEIIRIAQEAGFRVNTTESLLEELERFAALVASAERERIKQANAPEIERINAHIKELEDAVIAEREACAKMLEAASKTGKIISCTSAAKAIRARGQV
jgi:DNA-binding transcriptional MerR regulator